MAEPPITVRARNDSGGGNLTPTRVVVHTTSPVVGYPRTSQAGMAASTARYFAGGATIGSAHYIVDVAGEQHCVPDSVVANHAPPNGHSIGIEICAEGGNYPQSYTRAQWLSPQVWPAVLLAAARTRELCDRFGIPRTKLSPTDLLAGRKGICGHVDVSNAWRQSQHSDPGPGFPWVEFLAAVNGTTPPSAPAVSKPRVREDDAMYIKCQPDKSKPEWIAVLDAPFFVGLSSAGEIASANAEIAAGARCQWVEKATWDEFDRRSHAVCDNPRPVTNIAKS